MKKVILTMLAAAALCGCTTTVKVSTDQPGAIVRYRGEGRAAFRWKTAPTASPTEFGVRYGRISVYAIWPDGKESEHVMRSLSSSRPVEEINLVKPR